MIPVERLQKSEERLNLHRLFWNFEAFEHIPASFRLGNYFFADKFKAALPLLKPGLKIEPEMLKVDEFLEDYERLFQEIETIGQDGFWTAEPFTGIPWMEAIMGCAVFAGENSFITEPAEMLPGSDLIKKIEANPWYVKYMEFVEKLVQLSDGRFPIGQPILRGISDVLGAIMGQTEMIYGMCDEPEPIEGLASLITKVFLKIIEEQQKLIPEFYGGYSMGFYHLWTPGQCIWFQEDLSAILSPELYRDFILEHNRDICSRYDYSAVHLHSSSFHILDDILSIQDLKAVEINKDVGGPGIQELLSIFQKVLDHEKRLVIWGNLDENEIMLIKNNFSGNPVFINIVAKDIQTAKRLMSHIKLN